MIKLLIIVFIFLVSSRAQADTCETAVGYDQPGTLGQCDSARSSGANFFLRSPATTTACADLGIVVTYNYSAKAYNCDCPAAGTKFSEGFYDIGTNPDVPVATQTCDGSCGTQYSGSGVTKRAMIAGVYHYFYGAGQYDYTGEPCISGQQTPPAGPVPPNSCDPATQQSGQVNGVTVCLPKSDSNNTNTTTSPPVTDPTTGNTTTTSNTTTTNTTNNTTTNITTTTTTAPDGTVTQSQTETTTKNPPSNFCQANPTDPSCLKNSKFCEDNPETLGCATLGTVTDSVVPTVERSIANITPKTIGGAGGCPAPVTSSFMGRSISFSYDMPCQAAGMLRPLILALAWLAAGVIFIGGVRQ